LLFFFFIFLTFLFISFCYNLNLFLFIKYSVWLDMIISWEYYLNHMDNISFINKIRLIYKVFFMSVEMVEKDPDIFKSLRTFNNHKKK
jgi:beta-lactamase regulating signal transducer with metallopeptidase domain